jgi:hypothetical protein
MPRAHWIGRHLYRVEFSYRFYLNKFRSTGNLNITTGTRGLSSAGLAARSVMHANSFRNRYQEAVIKDICYLGSLDT